MTQADPTAEWWTTTDVAAYLSVRVATVSSYRGRGQMPAPDMMIGRTHAWHPATIIEWHASRPRIGFATREWGLEEMLGIDMNRPADQHAHALIVADSNMMKALVARREDQGLSQADVAARLGLTAEAVGGIESGDPHLSTLRRYAMAVGSVVDHSVKPFEPEVGQEEGGEG